MTSENSMSDFYRENTGDNGNRGNGPCPSQYIGFIGCGTYAPGGGGSILPAIPDDQQIPGFPSNKPVMITAEVAKALEKALAAAEALASQLCKNRKMFTCDDGSPENYPGCGEKNNRCDSVTINVSIDAKVEWAFGNNPKYKDLLNKLRDRVKNPKTTNCM